MEIPIDLIDSRDTTDEIALSQKVVDGDLIAARLNDDEQDDIIVFTHFIRQFRVYC